MLWRALTSVGAAPNADQEEPGWSARLRADSSRCRAQAALLLPKLAATALEPLRAAGYQAVVMKGAALAARYPEPGLRPMDDVDLLLPQDQHERALRVLAGEGWQRRSVLGRHHHEVVLTHDGVPGLPLELHRGLSTWIRRANRLSAVDLWRRRQPTVVGGVSTYGFSPEDELVTLAAHAGKPFHIFDRLVWVTDLAVVSAAAGADGEGLDWDRVAELTARARCATAVAVALTMAARLGVDSPLALRRVPATGARLAALAPLLSPEWPITARDEGIRNRLRYALVDDARLRIALLAENVVGAGPADTARKITSTGFSLVRRWRQLRRSSQGRREQVRKPVEP